jgi:hypothetical protein
MTEEEPLSAPRSTDPDVLAQELRLELARKRILWQKARQRYTTWRMFSILLLVLIFLAALLAYFYLSQLAATHR